jgi:hypothetical protein
VVRAPVKETAPQSTVQAGTSYISKQKLAKKVTDETLWLDAPCENQANAISEGIVHQF